MHRLNLDTNYDHRGSIIMMMIDRYGEEIARSSMIMWTDREKCNRIKHKRDLSSQIPFLFLAGIKNILPLGGNHLSFATLDQGSSSVSSNPQVFLFMVAGIP